MNKISIAVAALIGTASANQWIVDPSKFDSFAQTTAGAAAASGSGVRAKWIELPNCQSLVIESATGLEYEPTFGEVIPLADDLSNAIIANCKGPSVAKGISTPQTPTPITTNVPVPQSQIFDDVWKTDTVIPDAEHQVSQLQHGKVDFSDQTSGPTGDFQPAWKYTNGSPQPYQGAGASWNVEGAAGANYTGYTSPTNYGPEASPSAGAGLVQLTFIDSAAQKEWVELPDCTGASGEVKLFLGKENATSATCKAAAWDSAPVAPVTV